MQLKKSVRTSLIGLLAATTAVAAGGFIVNNSQKSYAETEQDYYYVQLSADAKRFYDAIADMDKTGKLKAGNAEYDLISNNVLTTAQLNSYSKSPSVMTAFGAARDAYYLDHPEVFYVDFSYLSVSVGTKNGEFTATLGTGRSDTYLVEGFTSENVAGAITEYENALKAITDKAAAEENAVGKIKSVNADLVNKITYSFCPDDAAAAVNIRNSYGALVNGKAVCEGYTRAFKCAMDKLGIPCEIVQGYASYEGGLEPHAWNAVKIDNVWYGVDVTWNDSTGKAESYLLRGASSMDGEHISDGVISAANVKFEYPLLNPDDYGVSSDDISVSYDDNQHFKVSYNNKNATKLKEENLYLVYRSYNLIGDKYDWTVWTIANQYSVIMGTPEENDTYTTVLVNEFNKYLQFAVIKDKAPDLEQLGNKVAYSYDSLTMEDIVCTSKQFENADFGKSPYAPYVKETKPDCNAANLDVTKTYDIEITYTQKLKLKDESKKVDISVSTMNADALKYMVISDVKFDGTDKVSFKFTPSAMYQHRDEAYTFTPVNLVGFDNEEAPMAVTYLTKNNNVACNRMYPDGRLYVNTYGQPSLVGSGDLSLNNWIGEDNKPVSENQRSQLMLVASKPNAIDNAGMVDKVNGELPEGAVKTAQTFEIELNLCKNIARIPEGSTVQVAFGFPAGYGPEDEGVTFQVYHFHRGEDGKIDYDKTEKIDCVITQYGLVVNISDFSPFAVVAVDKEKAGDVKKSVLARSVGFGGTFEGGIAQLVDEGKCVTYTLKPDAGYKVAKVTLNGEDIAVTGNTLTLEYAQLSDVNTVEFHYVANRVAEYEKAQGIEVIYPDVSLAAAPVTPDTLGSTEPSGGANTENPKGGDHTGLIIALVVAGVGLVGGVAAVLILKRKKAQ